tara:strand:+ start:247 stop:498 length:252 start_codon:yes stop_codon:yes gene_type:complete
MVSARVSLNEYTNKVLAMIKAKYGLTDKSQAINKFIELYGEDVVEKEASDEYVKKILDMVDEYEGEDDSKRMSIEELDNLCEV